MIVDGKKYYVLLYLLTKQYNSVVRILERGNDQEELMYVCEVG